MRGVLYASEGRSVVLVRREVVGRDAPREDGHGKQSGEGSSVRCHRCRKYNTYQLRTLISNTSHFNSHNLEVQKYVLATETHKITMVLVMGLCSFLLYNARIGYENTYDMRGKCCFLSILFSRHK